MLQNTEISSTRYEVREDRTLGGCRKWGISGWEPAKESQNLRNLPGGLQLCGHIYFRLSVAKDPKPLLHDLDRFKKTVWNVIKRKGEIEAMIEMLESDCYPVLQVLPEFMESSKNGVEQVIRGSTIELAEVGDKLYGELLRMLYRMVNYCVPDLEVPDALSELISVLPPYWEDDLLIQFMMYEDLAIIVDSEKNSRTSFSPSRLEITFFNKQGKSLGPLKPKEFSDLYDKYRRNLALLTFIPSFVQRQYLMDQLTGIFK